MGHYEAAEGYSICLGDLVMLELQTAELRCKEIKPICALPQLETDKLMAKNLVGFGQTVVG
jgi:hypothetical protein